MTTELMNLQDTEKLGSIFVKSGFFADARQEAQAVVKVLAGRELGLGPIASMTGIYVVQGRITLSANVIAALIKRSGRYDFRVLEISDQQARIEFFEKTDGQRISLGVSTFTREDAAKANTQNMAKFARNMLYARALTNGARWFCPDVYAGGIFTPEEMGATVNGDGEVIDMPARVIQPEPQSDTPALGNGHDATPDAEWEGLKGGGTLVTKPVVKPLLTTDTPKPPTLRTGAFPTFAKAFAEDFTDYRLPSGEPNTKHILNSIAKHVRLNGEAVAEITKENITEIFDKLGDHALAKQAEAEMAGRAYMPPETPA